MKLKQVPYRLKLTHSSQILLDTLWHTKGTVRATAKALGISEYTLHMWRRRGKVPLKMVPRVAHFFNMPGEALNYSEWSQIKGSNLDWKSVVALCGFDKPIQQKILKGKHPVIKKEKL